MVQGLDSLLEGSGQAGLTELRDRLQEVLSERWEGGRLINEQRLSRRSKWSKSHPVYRLHFEVDGRTRSVIVKRLGPDIAQRNQFVTERWLPAVGLSQNGPPLLGVAAERYGRCVWHIYEDLGDCTLAGSDPEPGRVEAAVELIAQVHARFAGHALLAECRLWGGDLGMYFYTSSVRDAIRCLESLRPPHVELSPELSAPRDRLIERLLKLSDEQPFRAQMVAKLGGPETLLHGDLKWTTNMLVYRNGSGLQARLIDWDHAAVGPVFYDLSTFLITSPVKDRPWILDLYRHSLGRLGWHLPSVPDLNLLFSTAESARLANCIIWRALEVSQGHAESGLEKLASLEQCLETLEPVLPS
jgi:Ecdysteroid kinase-like family